MMENHPDSGTGAENAVGSKRPPGHAHLITIEALIVHRYSGTPALLRKADKLAQEIIAADLREGEYLRVLSPGRYRLHFPRLRPDAGQLRCAIIGDRIYRTVRHFNPTSFELYEAEDGPPKQPSKAASKTGDPSRAPLSESSSAAEEEEMRKVASQAMKMMINTDAVTREELVGSHLGRLLAEQIEFKRLPIWNVKTGLISAYECVPIRNGVFALKEQVVLQKLGGDPEEIKAIIDMIVYAHVGELLKQSCSKETKPLLICPVHASTLDRTRYLSAYLASGADIPRATYKSIVFLIKNVTRPASRTKVRQMAQYLHVRSRGLVAEVLLKEKDLSIFKETGFHGVRVSATRGVSSEKQFLDAMNAFVERCERSKLESFVAGVKTSSVALGALASGCSYLSGAVIAKRSGHRGGIEPFDIEGLFVRPAS